MLGTLREIAFKRMRVLSAPSTEWEGALLPYDPHTRVVSLMSDAITVKGSSTKNPSLFLVFAWTPKTLNSSLFGASFLNRSPYFRMPPYKSASVF